MRPAAAAVHRARTRRLKLAGPNSQARTRRARTLRGQNSAGPELCGARTPGARTPGPRTPGPRTRRARAKGHARPNAEKPDSGARARVQGIRSMGHAFPVRSRASRRRRSQSLARQLQRLPALARVDDAPQRARCDYGQRWTSDCPAARTVGISRAAVCDAVGWDNYSGASSRVALAGERTTAL